MRETFVVESTTYGFQNWVFPAVGVVLAILFGLAFVFAEPPLSTRQASWLGVLMLVALLMAAFVQIRARLQPGAVVVGFLPFALRTVPFKDIERVRAVIYKPIRQYGGWGIRWTFRDPGVCYTLGGTKGVRIDLADGRHFLFQVNDAEAFASGIIAQMAAEGVQVLEAEPAPSKNDPPSY